MTHASACKAEYAGLIPAADSRIQRTGVVLRAANQVRSLNLCSKKNTEGYPAGDASLGDIVRKWGNRYDLNKKDEDVFVANSSYARHLLKKRVLKNKLIEYVCSCCGLGPEWLGKPMPLILDHINGKNNDNRLENLRFVCSNCDTQLPTYKSKNKDSSAVLDGSQS